MACPMTLAHRPSHVELFLGRESTSNENRGRFMCFVDFSAGIWLSLVAVRRSTYLVLIIAPRSKEIICYQSFTGFRYCLQAPSTELISVPVALYKAR